MCVYILCLGMCDIGGVCWWTSNGWCFIILWIGQVGSIELGRAQWHVWLLGPHPGSQGNCGLTQVPVSSKNWSRFMIRSGCVNRLGKLCGWLLAVKCLRREVVCHVQCRSMCLIVWTSSPQGQATWSGVCCGKKHWVYAPTNAWPVARQ